MERNAAKGGSVARGAERICERCFASVPAGEAICPDCGAPMEGGAAFQGADAAVHTELARANVLRMRGDSKGAEEACLAILRRYPNNPAAHTLLGDVYAERWDLEQAAQWYELALDLDPESRVDKERLEAVRERMQAKDTATTAEQLGLPDRKPNLIPLAAMGAVAFVLAVAAGAAGFAVGQRNRPKPPPVVSGTIQAPPEETPMRTEVAPVAPPVPSPAPAVVSDEDQVLMNLLGRSAEGRRVMSAAQDPRARTTTVTFRLTANEDPRRLGATLAKTVLDGMPEAASVTVRGVRDGKLAYVADVPRALYAETQTSAWQSQHPTPDAWIAHVLQNEWSAAGSPTPTAPTNPPASANPQATATAGG